DVRSALDVLPDLPTESNRDHLLRATGTDGQVDRSAKHHDGTASEDNPVLAFCLALSERPEGISEDSMGRAGNAIDRADIREKPLFSRVFAGEEKDLKERPLPDSNRGMADLQSTALPLG